MEVDCNYNFANTQKKSTKFSRMLGEDEKMIPRKILLKNFKERPSKLEKGYSHDLVKQTGDLHDLTKQSYKTYSAINHGEKRTISNNQTIDMID